MIAMALATRRPFPKSSRSCNGLCPDSIFQVFQCFCNGLECFDNLADIHVFQGQFSLCLCLQINPGPARLGTPTHCRRLKLPDFFLYLCECLRHGKHLLTDILMAKPVECSQADGWPTQARFWLEWGFYRWTKSSRRSFAF